MKKGQAIIFILFILAIFGALSGGLTIMWQAELQTRSLERDGLVAFYLAQAGIERAKMQLATNEAWAGGGPYVLGTGTYTVSVSGVACPPGPYNTCVQITSTGNVASADRRIVTSVSLDTPPLDPPNTPGDEVVLDWSWREI